MTQAGNEEQFSWFDGLAALTELETEWQDLCASTDADIYSKPCWVKTWWRHFGKDRELISLIARDRTGALVGIVPFMIEKLWVGPFRIRVARLAATDPHTVLFTLPVRPDVIIKLMAKAFSDLLGAKAKADLVSFTPASEMSQVLSATREAVALVGSSDTGIRARKNVLLREEQIATHTVFQLPETFDEYLSKLSKKRRNQFRRDFKRLQTNYDIVTDLVHPNKREFGEFIEFHNAQWQETDKGGHFCDWRGSADFFRDLAEHEKASKTVCLYHLNGGPGILATQFSLVSGSTCHWRLPARSMDPALDQLSIGKIGLILMIRSLIETGIKRIEAGVGDYGYKLVYGGEAVTVHRLIVTRNDAWHRAKLSTVLGYARLLHVGYYRLWFGITAVRLRRSLPIPHSPLWKSWTRTRL